MTKSKSEFRTPDLYFAAYLQVAGVPMVNTVREGTRVFFVFDTAICNIEDLRNGWFANTAKVPALTFSNSLKSLKSLIHSFNG